MVPGLTTWRIDQARKHSAVVGEGIYEEREPVVRYRLDGEKVDHFLDFVSSPHYLQDVALHTVQESLKCQPVNPSRCLIWYEL